MAAPRSAVTVVACKHSTSTGERRWFVMYSGSFVHRTRSQTTSTGCLPPRLAPCHPLRSGPSCPPPFAVESPRAALDAASLAHGWPAHARPVQSDSMLVPGRGGLPLACSSSCTASPPAPERGSGAVRRKAARLWLAAARRLRARQGRGQARERRRPTKHDNQKYKCAMTYRGKLIFPARICW